MLDQVDLEKYLEKEEFKKVRVDLEHRTGEIQREARVLKIPIIVIFEGWDAAGKGTLINNFIWPLDPRGIEVNKIAAENEEERFKPFLWRFWGKTPANGRISIFDSSWYRRLSVDRFNDKSTIDLGVVNVVKSFERQLSDDGAIIFKFFLHISKQEQKKRLKKLDNDPVTSWRVTKQDWKNNSNYKKNLPVYQSMIQATDTSYAPWTIIESTDRHYAISKLLNVFIERMETVIADRREKLESKVKSVKKSPEKEVEPCKTECSILSKIDPAKVEHPLDYSGEMKRCQARLRELEHIIYEKRIPVVIVYEGWDAAGKGGNIKRVTENLDPRGYRVIPVAAPTDIELNHHYLWRFWINLPKAGHIAIFDRSWYGRVLVERVEGFCSQEEWKRAYKEINEMEEQLADNKTVVIKFWLHIDKDEQLRRFEERKVTPHKQWKITDEDWRNREKWDQYESAVNEMIFRTSTGYAPWVVVESNDKKFARLKTIKTIIERLEAAIR